MKPTFQYPHWPWLCLSVSLQQCSVHQVQRDTHQSERRETQMMAEAACEVVLVDAHLVLSAEYQAAVLVTASHHLAPLPIHQQHLHAVHQATSLNTGRCAASLYQWGYSDNPLCICGDTQSMSQMINECPVNKFEGGLPALHTEF